MGAGNVLKMIVSSVLKLQIHNRYPLTDAQQAHRDLEGQGPAQRASVKVFAKAHTSMKTFGIKSRFNAELFSQLQA